MTVPIELTRGLRATVDDEDADLATLNWYAVPSGRTFYARRRSEAIKLHVVVGARMGIAGEVDHIDRDGLNCRRSNLRSATRAQNTYNQGLRRDNVSGFKGVHRCFGKWRASIGSARTRRTVGMFESPIAAALAYDRVAQELHGEFAYLNFRVDTRIDRLLRSSLERNRYHG